MTPKVKLTSDTKLTAFVTLERAILYSRTSGDDSKKEGRNLASQLDMGREFAKEKGYAVLLELAEDDKGESGYEIDLPQLNQIREMAHRGEFDVLIVRELDRLSRNLAKQLIVEDELKRCGVRIEYVLAEYDDTAEGRLQKHIRATVAEYEREKIKERMTRGKRNKVKDGNVSVSGRPPFGYLLTNNRLEIIPAEAEVVRFIFQLFIDGLTVEAIRSKLTALGIPTPGDLHKFKGIEKKNAWGHWGRASVYNILTNSAYAGHWFYGKERYEKKRIGGKFHYTKIKNSPSTWIEVHVPPIINEDVFNFVQEQLSENSERRGKPGQGEWLFSKRVICGECGYKMHCEAHRKDGKIKYTYYQCPCNRNRDLSHKSCNQKGFRQDVVDNRVWGWIEEILSDRAKLENELNNIEAKRNTHSKLLQEQLESANNQIALFQQDLNDTLSMLKDLKKGGRAYALVLNDIERLEDTLGKIEVQRNRIAEQLSQGALSPERVAKLTEYADKVAAGLEVAREDFNLRKAIVDNLDVKVTLIREDDKAIAYVTCFLYDAELILSTTNHSRRQYDKMAVRVALNARLEL